MLPDRSTDSWDLTKLSNSELFRREALTFTFLKSFLGDSGKCVKDQLPRSQVVKRTLPLPPSTPTSTPIPQLPIPTSTFPPTPWLRVFSNLTMVKETLSLLVPWVEPRRPPSGTLYMQFALKFKTSYIVRCQPPVLFGSDIHLCFHDWN